MAEQAFTFEPVKSQSKTLNYEFDGSVTLIELSRILEEVKAMAWGISPVIRMMSITEHGIGEDSQTVVSIRVGRE